MMIPSMRRGAAARSFGLLLLMTASACTAGRNNSPPPSPSASASAPMGVQLPDYNGRLGSNRLAAEVAALLGRDLYPQVQNWEVYVSTQPPILPGRYDPGDPAASRASAALVTRTDVVIASEAIKAVKAFGAGGEAHEKAVLAGLDADLRKAFPNVATDTVRVYYGESFQRGVATFDHGRLTQYTVRTPG